MNTMCPAYSTEIFAAVAGWTAGGAGALALLWLRCKSAKPMAEPPSPTFQEWIAAILAEEEEEEERLRASVPFAVANG
ncbi:MAG TPA: hypothetical protein VJR04_00295 [Terriglobales bacterium]|nr:hypothetical protein [Terriglobales bacterium]